ncbi:dienelactone hydrolase [Diaporthe sp. PMI_573]|nr:dienelactone hydrolase [Diaporthaceae sp. PMI_573]
MASKESKGKDTYLAQPPSSSCWVGTVHKGTPRGNLETILDVPTYVARPTPERANGHIVLYFPDVWGMSNNAQLLMDCFADAGFLTLGMDYFRGDPLSKYRQSMSDPPPEGFDHAAWRVKHWDFASENVPKWFDAVRVKYGDETTKYACTGYCFGAPFVCDLLAGDNISAGAFAHPTALKEEHFLKLRHPLLLSCAENDHAFDTGSRRKAVDILQREEKKYHLQLFRGAAHGFAVRGDPDDPYQRWCKEQSLRAIVDWFVFWLVASH